MNVPHKVSTTMAHEFRLSHRVEFADTDAAGIMHFSRFFPCMEKTEHAFYRSLGLSVMTKESDRISTFPRVAASCDYMKPLRFEDEFDVRLIVAEKKQKVLRYVFDFLRPGDDGSDALHARGSITVVHAHKPYDGGPMKAAPLPQRIVDAIDVAPAQLLASLEAEGR